MVLVDYSKYGSVNLALGACNAMLCIPSMHTFLSFELSALSVFLKGHLHWYTDMQAEILSLAELIKQSAHSN